MPSRPDRGEGVRHTVVVWQEKRVVYTEFHGQPHGCPHSVPLDESIRAYFPDYNYQGTMVEVGVPQPIHWSNSYHFERNGWTVACIEPDPRALPRLAGIRRLVLPYACGDRNQDSVPFVSVESPEANGALSALAIDPRMLEKWPGALISSSDVRVDLRTLDFLLEMFTETAERIDVITIDVEGWEAAVLRGLDLDRWQPKLVVIEDVFSDPTIRSYMESYGYRSQRRDEINDFYFRS